MKKISLASLLLFSTSFAVQVPVDVAQSTMRWEGFKIGKSHYGTLALKPNSTLEFKNSELVGGNIQIDMKSLKDEDLQSSPEMQTKLLTHLNSKDFFSVDEYPTSQFVIKSVTPLKTPEKGLTHEITGDLTIKGITHPATFKAELMKHGSMFHAHAKTAVDRTLYNVRYGSLKFFSDLADKAIKDNFDVEFNVYAKVPTEETKGGKKK
jgi:polyisoprenoid-binding protein YceI